MQTPHLNANSLPGIGAADILHFPNSPYHPLNISQQNAQEEGFFLLSFLLLSLWLINFSIHPDCVCHFLLSSSERTQRPNHGRTNTGVNRKQMLEGRFTFRQQDDGQADERQHHHDHQQRDADALPVPVRPDWSNVLKTKKRCRLNHDS